jgi:hypothetical protein
MWYFKNRCLWEIYFQVSFTAAAEAVREEMTTTMATREEAEEAVEAVLLFHQF